MPDVESLDEAVRHGCQHSVQVGLRTQFAREFHERAAIVVAIPIEVLVQTLLNPVTDGLEQKRGHQHDNDQAGVAHVLEILLHQAAQREDDAVERGQHAQRGERVCVAAPEDDIDIHQPVAHDGVGEGQRDQHQRQYRHLHVGIGQGAHRVGSDIENRERQDPAEDAIAQPLKLLAHDRIVGLAILRAQHQAAREIDAGEKGRPEAVHEPAYLHQRHVDAQHSGGYACEQGQKQRGGYIKKCCSGGRPQPAARLGEGKAEVKKNRRSQDAGHHVAEINDLIEGIQLTGVMETGENKRSQAKNVEVLRLVCATAAKINKQSNNQVGHSDHVLIRDGPILGNFADNDRGFEIHAAPMHDIFGLIPGADPHQHLRNLRRLGNR